MVFLAVFQKGKEKKIRVFAKFQAPKFENSEPEKNAIPYPQPFHTPTRLPPIKEFAQKKFVRTFCSLECRGGRFFSWPVEFAEDLSRNFSRSIFLKLKDENRRSFSPNFRLIFRPMSAKKTFPRSLLLGITNRSSGIFRQTGKK